MEEFTVCLTQGKYNELIEKAQIADMLFRAIYVGSELSYGGDKIRIDSDRLNTFLSIADSGRYQQVLADLQAEKAAKEAAKA